MPKPREIPQNLPDNNRRLVELGRVMFDENWQNPMARALGVNASQVMRWVWGGYEVSDERLAQARDIARRRAQNIFRVLDGIPPAKR
jgi:hypothetical protein